MTNTDNQIQRNIINEILDISKQLKNQESENLKPIIERLNKVSDVLETQGQAQAFIENANDVLFVLTPDGVFHFVSPQWKAAFGYELSEAVGQSFIPFVHPEDIPSCMTFLQKVMTTGEKQSGVEMRVLRKDGSYVWYRVNGSLMKDSMSGNPMFCGIGRDITEHNHIMDELIKSETRFRSYFELPFHGITVTSPEAGWINVNDRVCSILGYSREELLRKTWTEMTHPDDLPKDVAQFERVLNGEIDQYELEKRFIRKSGEAIWIHLTVGCVRRIDGSVDYLVATLEDITEQKQNERLQSLSNEVLSILNQPVDFAETIDVIFKAIKKATNFEAIGIRLGAGGDYPYYKHSGFTEDFLRHENTLLARDHEGKVYRNKDGRACLECTCGLVIHGKTDPNYIPLTETGSVWTNGSKALLGIPNTDDPRLNPRNRCINYGYNSVALIPIKSNEKIIGLLQINDKREDCFNSDLIKYFEGISTSIGVAFTRRETEDALRQSEYFFRESQRSAFIGSYSTDFVTGFWKSSEVLDAIFGIDKSYERSVKGWLDIVHPDDQNILARYLTEEVIGRKQPFSKEYRIVRKNDGETRWVIGHGEVALDSIGTVTSMIGTIQDITDRKRLEKEAMDAQSKLLHSSKLASVGLLAAEVAHEIKNPLAIIKGHVEVIADALEEMGGSDEVERSLDKQNKAIERVEKIVNGLRTFARPDKDILEPMDIHQALRDTLAICETIYVKNGITINAHLKSIHPLVHGNPGKFQQVIMNLLSNAKDACEAVNKGGIISIDTSDEGAFTVLKISDNGSGISQEHLSKIFDPFFTTKAPGKGTGLGLPISSEIIKTFGGTFTVDSEVGFGTTFTIRLLPTNTAV
jgi:PAS domain S-box-containing protein